MILLTTLWVWITDPNDPPAPPPPTPAYVQDVPQALSPCALRPESMQPGDCPLAAK